MRKVELRMNEKEKYNDDENYLKNKKENKIIYIYNGKFKTDIDFE